MAYVIAAAGLKVSELPIIFYERASGSSKMTKKIIREAVLMPWKLRLRRIAGVLGKSLARKKYVKEISC
jgi:dolichol-phosphate mannosyltransferase